MAAVLACGPRSLGPERIFPGDGTVIFSLGDAFYHARRAFVSFEQFPRVLLFDPYLNFPQGAFVPWPPLYDLALGGMARLFGSTQSAFERVAAWAPVALGVLTLAPVYAAGRLVASRAAGVGAALLFAVLPATVLYSNVGNADHHAAQAFLGASVLALSLRAVSEEPRPRASVGWTFAVLAVFRAALLLTWPGSLVYLALTEGCLVAAGVLAGRREILVGEAWSAAASAVLVLPAVVSFVLLVGVLGYVVWAGAPALAGGAYGSVYELRQFAASFLKEYWLHFELTSVLLVVAVVAAVAVIQVHRGRRD